MKVKIYVLDLELPKPTRKALRIIGLAAVLIAGGTIAAYAAVRHTFMPGRPILAQQVNENFAELDTRLVDVEERSRDGVRISLSGVMCGASGPTTGAISDPGSGTIGWRAAKIICETTCSSPTAHMCSADELIRTAQIGAIPDGTHWMAAGAYSLVPPVGAPKASWDCAGWTNGSDVYGGGLWGAGMDACGTVGIFQSCPSYAECNNSFAIACCD